MHEQMRLTELMGSIRAGPEYSGALAVRVQSCVGLTPPGSWKGKHAPQVSICLRTSSLDGTQQQTKASGVLDIPIAAGAVSWHGEELNFDLEAQARVHLEIQIDGRTIGTQELTLPWKPPPLWASIVAEVPCLWKDVKHLKVSAAKAAQMSTVVLESQFSWRHNLPSTTAEQLACGDLSKDQIQQTMSFSARKHFLALMDAYEKHADADNEVPLQWILGEFGETFMVTQRVRELCELKILLRSFQPTEAFLQHLFRLLDHLDKRTNPEIDPVDETATHRAILEHVKSVLLRCFSTYKTTFAGDIAETNAIKLAFDLLRIACRPSGERCADLVEAEVRNWPSNVVDRITGGALRNDAEDDDSLKIATRKQQALSAEALLRLCDVVKEDIQSDDIVFQWAFPEEVQLVNIMCQEYYSAVQNGVFMMVNGDAFSICRAVRLANPKSITISDRQRGDGRADGLLRQALPDADGGDLAEGPLGAGHGVRPVGAAQVLEPLQREPLPRKC